MHQSKGHSSSLVLTIRKLNLWELTRVALITLHYRQCKAMAYTLFLAPSLRTVQHVLGGRLQTKIASQQQGAAIHGHPIIDGEIYCASGLFRQIEDKTKVAADERASSRLPPSSHHLHTAMESLDLWHRDTFIHHGSAMFIASGFVTRVYCLNKLSCAPQRGFFEASADCDELEYDVAWLVTALQKVDTLISITQVECHANKCLVCSSSPIQILSHALCPFHMITIDDESPEDSYRVPISPTQAAAMATAAASGQFYPLHQDSMTGQMPRPLSPY
ncbi:Transcriptional activator [Penicillium rubens]|nr:Transcriptional activator [Penicillium rubens]